MLPLDCALEFDPASDADFFAALPSGPAVFRIEPRTPGEPFLARTADLRRRLARLLGAPEPRSKRLNLRNISGVVRYRRTASAFEQALAFYQQARDAFPRRYRELARLRPPALLKLNRRAEYPRCYVTRRMLHDGGLYIGPFASRKIAEQYASEFLNLFKLRRCQIKIRRDPAFPGCIYSEMKMCLAPCFAGCSKEEYDAEVRQAAGFLSTQGASLEVALEAERNTASEAMDFERAAALHRRIEKAAGVTRGLPEIVRDVREVHAVVVQPAAEENAAALFVVRSGRILEPLLLRFADLQSQPRPLEQILKEQLDALAPLDGPANAAAPLLTELSDHLALLARWYYSSPRQGEIFFPQEARGRSTAARWPYRRIVRACSRLFSGAAPGTPEDALPAESPRPET